MVASQERLQRELVVHSSWASNQHSYGYQPWMFTTPHHLACNHIVISNSNLSLLLTTWRDKFSLSFFLFCQNPIGSSGGGLDTSDLVSYVFIQVTVWRASVPVLCCVGQTFPGIVGLVPRTEGPTQALRRSLIRTVLCRSLTSVFWSLMMEIMPQIFQIQCPWSQLLPVHSLEGHDAMQIASNL